jgi:alpha-amylase
MRRRPEAYHEKLREHDRAAAAPSDGRPPAQPASIHDIVMTKQEGLSELLHYDHYERRSALVRLLPPATTAAEFDDGTARDLVGALDGHWSLESLGLDHVAASFREGPVEIRKTIRIGGGRLDPALSVEVDVVNVSSGRFDAVLGIEFAVMLLGGGHNPAAFHEVDGRRVAHDGRLEVQSVARLQSGNSQVGVALETLVDSPVAAWIAPIESVSNSEAGFELVYQGSAILLHRPISLAPGERTSLRVEQCVTVRGTDGGEAASDDGATTQVVKAEAAARP